MRQLSKNKLIAVVLLSFVLGLTSVHSTANALSAACTRAVTVPPTSDGMYDPSGYYGSSNAFSVNKNDSVTVTWKSRIKYTIYLYNSTSGNSTSKKTSSGSVSWTSLKKGSYKLYVAYAGNSYYDENWPDQKNSCLRQSFTIS